MWPFGENWGKIIIENNKKKKKDRGVISCSLEILQALLYKLAGK